MQKYITFSEVKKNLAIAIPVSISQLGHMVVAVVDTLMAGRLGGLPLASATLAMSIVIPFMMICIGMTYGLTPLVARNYGNNNDTRGNTLLLKNAFVLNMLVGVLLVGLLLLMTNYLGYVNPNKELVALAKPFFVIQTLSLIPLVFFQVIKQFCEGFSITKQATIITVIANIINIALIFLFIDSEMGNSTKGFMGIAYSTLIARVFMMVAIFVFFITKKEFGIYKKLYGEVKIRFLVLKNLLKDSLPIGLQLMLESGAFGFAAILAGWIGANEIAAHQISLNIAAVTYMIATGISSSTTVRVGFEMGKKDFSKVLTATYSAMTIILVYEVVACAFFVTFREQLPYFYISDSVIVAMASSLLLITALFQLSDGVQVVAMGALRGLGDIRTPTLIAVVSYWLLGLPIGYLLAFKFGFGVYGVWYGLLAGLTISAILLIVRLANKFKKMAALAHVE